MIADRSEGAHPFVPGNRRPGQASRSEHERKTALRLASIPNLFEFADPPILTAVPDRGRKPSLSRLSMAPIPPTDYRATAPPRPRLISCKSIK